jgi:hypothetical protein
MRSLISCLVLLLVFSSCDTWSSKSKFDNIPRSDTTCIKAVNKARADIAQGNRFYCYHAGSLLYQPLRCQKEMDSILNIYGISYKNVTTSDVIYEGQTQNCYGDYMNDKINEKFGSNFLDSLLYKADSIYITKIPDEIFDYHECDTDPIFPGDTSDNNRNFNPGLQILFNTKVTYPTGYIKKTKKDVLGFINTKIEQYSFVFDNDNNLTFQKHFRYVYEQMLKEARWTPATIKKQNVSSRISTLIYLE